MAMPWTEARALAAAVQRRERARLADMASAVRAAAADRRAYAEWLRALQAAGDAWTR